MKRLGIAAGLAACLGGLVWYRRNWRMPLKEYTRWALYMAVLDDAICRRELDGLQIGGECIRFPPKADSLQYRYHLFLQGNRKKSREMLRSETAQLEQRLRQARLDAVFPRANWTQTPLTAPPRCDTLQTLSPRG